MDTMDEAFLGGLMFGFMIGLLAGKYILGAWEIGLVLGALLGIGLGAYFFYDARKQRKKR